MSTAPKKRWSQEVTEKSDALDLDKGAFTWKNPDAPIAGARAIAFFPPVTGGSRHDPQGSHFLH